MYLSVVHSFLHIANDALIVSTSQAEVVATHTLHLCCYSVRLAPHYDVKG